MVTFCNQLKLIAEDGKIRETDCANTEGIFKIIQSIPSKKAEPFKRWLAKVGYDRIKEIENPELAQERMKLEKGGQRLIPKEYIQKYGIDNLWWHPLANAWRLVYSLSGEENIKILAIIIDYYSHKEYERRFHY